LVVSLIFFCFLTLQNGPSPRHPFYRRVLTQKPLSCIKFLFGIRPQSGKFQFFLAFSYCWRRLCFFLSSAFLVPSSIETRVVSLPSPPSLLGIPDCFWFLIFFFFFAFSRVWTQFRRCHQILFFFSWSVVPFSL